MIRHVVMWKFEDGEGRTKQENMEFVKANLLALPAIIPQIKRMEIGMDIAHTPASYDMMLLTEFESMEALATYRDHPEHMKVSKYVGKVSTARVVADCEI